MAQVQLSQLEKKYGKPLVFMLTGGFERLIDRSGGVLQSLRLVGCEGDWLLVISVTFDERWRVAFMGSVTAAGAIVRAERQLRDGEVNWRKDKWKPDD